jgi:hypothetical protein
MDWFFRPKVQLGLFVNFIFVVFTVVSPIFGERIIVDVRPRAIKSEMPPVSYVNLPPRKLRPQATSFFDSGINQVSVSPKDDLTFSNKSGGKLTLSPIFSVSGSAIRAPREVLLRIYSFTRASADALPDECEVEVKSDGGNFWASAKVAHDTTSVGDTKVEGMGVYIPYATFLGIVSSEHVNFRVGQDEVTLTTPQLEALRDMQRCIQDGHCA